MGAPDEAHNQPYDKYGVEKPFISKKMFNRVRKHLPTHENTEKINAGLVVIVLYELKKVGRYEPKSLKNIVKLISLESDSANGAKQGFLGMYLEVSQKGQLKTKFARWSP